MLNFELFDGEIYLSTNDGDNSKCFGFIRYIAGLGFFLHINEDDFSKAYYAGQNEHGCIPAWKNLEACKYYALALYLEHNPE